MKVFRLIGGLDIEVLPVSEYLFRNIEKYKDDEFFFNRALALFNLEYKKYFDNEIEETEQLKEYKKIALEYMDYAKEQLTAETENILVEEECMEM